MDPVTHGLVGAAAGLSVLAASRRRAKALVAPDSDGYEVRWVAALCGLIAGELPDADRAIDTFYKGFGSHGQGLTYMLYHRGPTHTVLACVVAAPLLALLIRSLAPRHSPPLAQLVLIAALGLVLHLAMDGMNDYGVHPFPPLSQRWFYGDFLFLAEPTLWAALLPYILLMFGVSEPRLLMVCGLLGAATFAGLVLLNQWLRPFGAVLALVCMVVQALLQRRGPRPSIAWASVVVVIAVFLLVSRLARERAVEWTARLAPNERLSDVVTTPAPANPFCWRVIALTKTGDSFVARMGMISFWPSLVNASTCYAPPKGLVPSSVREVRPRPKSAAPPGDALPQGVWQFAEFHGTFSGFEELAKNPRVGATRHYLRVPFWGRDARSAFPCECACADGERGAPSEHLLIGDLRVDYDKEDVSQFCKYPFERGDKQAFGAHWFLGAAPFFPSPSEPPAPE